MLDFGRESPPGVGTGAVGKAGQPGWKPCVAPTVRLIIQREIHYHIRLRAVFVFPGDFLQTPYLFLLSIRIIAACSMAGRDAPLFANTEADKGAIVVVVTFATVMVTTLGTSIRSYIRRQKYGHFGLDDVMLIAANVSATRASRASKAVEHMNDQSIADTGDRTKSGSGKSGHLWPGPAYRCIEQCLNGSILPGS